MALVEGIEQIGTADIVVGLIPPSSDPQELDGAIARIVESAPPVRAVLLYPPYSPNAAEAAASGSPWHLMVEPRLAQDRSALAQSLGDSFRAIFGIAQKLGARACAMIASDPATVTAEWVELLLHPILEERYDLTAPCYARHPFEGMINRAIVYPLVRTLYGKQIRNPLGPDFGVSCVLLDRMCERPTGHVHLLMSLVSEAVTGDLRICQSHLGPRRYAPPDWTNLSSLLARVLGPLFLDVERHAAWWQRARVSQPVAEFGEPMFVPGPGSVVDVSRLIESFQLGARNLPEIWGVILAPSTLMELRKLARQPAAAFRMPDDTWARIVYDFVLAHRLRAINRDQMLRALTPIYLAWVASYALEVENTSPEFVEQRLEKLCVAYENTKPHFVARWRWPDRFNP